jgi:inositol-phosphate transport system permease protein
MTELTLNGTGPSGAARPDWVALGQRARRRQGMLQVALAAFLAVVSLPIILPYFWMLVISFTARTGGVSADVLWKACAVIVPAVLIYSVVHLSLPSRRARLVTATTLILLIAVLLLWLIGGRLHLDNYRFLWRANIVEELRKQATAGGQFPWVWTAFRNSLLLSLAQTVVILTASSLAGYYISRFAFLGREAFLQGLLIAHAFPALTLIIPIFLMLHWLHLLDTIFGVMLVLAAIELPFYIFVMKGFFDGVPWEIEMSAMTDGATRRQAFRLVVLPQVRVGLIAVAVFAFIRAWEEYIFVRTMLIENRNWVMSLYLFWVSEDVMGVDYGIVAAVSVFYVLPSLLLYVFCQKYLTQMTIGGIRG